MGGESYKVWGSVLVALTTALAIGIVINEATHSDHLETNAYKVDVLESSVETAAAPAAPVIEPIGPLLASADAAAGGKIFKRCATCHSIDKGGPNKVGPNLFGVIGGPKAHASDFAYSDAIKAMGGEWTYEDLNAFLTKPRDFIAGTKMTFAGLKKLQDRANIIAFLRQHADTPFPLPTQ